jgi:NAD(P)-dependent dehydrogenase (short-subunit alcohol dehydrogenase family)
LPPTPTLDSQVALVTGGGRGLGRAFAEGLAAAGAAVAVVARSADQLAETVHSVTERGGRAIAYAADVTAPGAAQRVIAEVEATLGPLDLLVNNAGTSGPLGPLWRSDGDAWWRCMEVNLRAPLDWSRAALQGMIARRGGRIINVASGAGIVAIPFFSAYVTSKAALIRASEILAAEVAEHGISVFAIEPGTVRTALAEYALESPEGQRWMPWFKRIFDEGRDESPERGVALVRFLASGGADALSGRFLTVADDVARLAAEGETLRREERYTLRLRR